MSIYDDETPNLELYEWLQELAELGDTAVTDVSRKTSSARAKPVDELFDLLAAMARIQQEDGGGGSGRFTASDLVELEAHCREVGPGKSASHAPATAPGSSSTATKPRSHTL